eukprot:6483871-Amphidinium_carterae.1
MEDSEHSFHDPRDEEAPRQQYLRRKSTSPPYEKNCSNVLPRLWRQCVTVQSHSVLSNRMWTLGVKKTQTSKSEPRPVWVTDSARGTRARDTGGLCDVSARVTGRGFALLAQPLYRLSPVALAKGSARPLPSTTGSTCSCLAFAKPDN